LKIVGSMLNKLLAPIDGYKTHVGVIGHGVLQLAKDAEWLSPEDMIYKVAFWFLTTWTTMSVKHSWDKKNAK